MQFETLSLDLTMDDIDKEISFLQEKIKELSDESIRLKEKENHRESTPLTSRDSGIGCSAQSKGAKSSIEFGGARPKVKFEAHLEDDVEYYSPKDVRPVLDNEEFFETPHRVQTNITTRKCKADRARTLNDPVEKDNSSKLKPATYDGSTSWLDYRSHFNACACLNHWSEVEKGMYLALSLRGQAQGVIGNLPEYLQMNFKELSKSLEERFSPVNQTELYRAQLRERRQKATESIPQLGQDIRRLTR